ncbi:hypothetical protein Tco_0324484 [Tanacetum coccineum]
MIVDPGAKLVNGMVKHKDYLLRGPYHGNNSIFLLSCHGVRWQVQLGRVGPDRVAVIRPAWSKFMRRNVDQDVRFLHFVEEGHDTLYVATYNKYGLENHAYKETKFATAIGERVVPPYGSQSGGSCVNTEVQDFGRNVPLENLKHSGMLPFGRWSWLSDDEGVGFPTRSLVCVYFVAQRVVSSYEQRRPMNSEACVGVGCQNSLEIYFTNPVENEGEDRVRG